MSNLGVPVGKWSNVLFTLINDAGSRADVVRVDISTLAREVKADESEILQNASKIVATLNRNISRIRSSSPHLDWEVAYQPRSRCFVATLASR